MTVQVTRKDGVVQDFARFADRYIKHVDGSLEVIRGGTAPPARYPAGSWITVRGDHEKDTRGVLGDFISRLVHP